MNRLILSGFIGVFAIVFHYSELGYAQFTIVCSTAAPNSCSAYMEFEGDTCGGYCDAWGHSCVDRKTTRVNNSTFLEQVPVPPKAPGFSSVSGLTPVSCVVVRKCEECVPSLSNPLVGTCGYSTTNWDTLVFGYNFILSNPCQG